MKSTEVLAGLLSVELLKNQTLQERVKHLESDIEILNAENEELYKTLEKYQQPAQTEHHTIGYKH